MPTTTAALTEDQIERRVESQTDNADRLYMNGSITEAQYNTEMRRINREAEALYGVAKRDRAEG